MRTFCMEAHFCHRIKIKVIATYLAILTLFLTTASLYIATATYELAILSLRFTNLILFKFKFQVRILR